MLKKIRFHSFFYILASGALLSMLFSCSFPREEEEKPPAEGTWLYSYEALTGSDIGADYLSGILTAFSAEFADFRIQPLMRYPVRVYRVIYKTTYKGKTQKVSGAVAIPRGDAAPPIISYQHGTLLADREVPSRFRSVFSMEPEMGLMQAAASMGFIVAASDYLGYAESGDIPHPYHHGESLGRSCADMLRAVKELLNRLNISYKNEYYLTGYSEGGYATAALQKFIETQFPAEFPIKAVSAGAGAYDLEGTVSAMMEQGFSVSPSYASLLLVSYNDAYGWERNLADIFREPYLSQIREGLLAGNYTVYEADSRLTPDLSLLLDMNFIASYRGSGETTFKAAFKENNLHEGWTPSAPLRLYHGSADAVVPDFNSERAWLNFTANGAASVEYIPLQGQGHASGIFPWVKGTLLWFAQLK